MKLSGDQVKQLHRALLGAFPDVVSLRRLVRMELEENLSVIAGGTDLSETVFNLIEWATAQGKLAELVERAYLQNSGNPDLKRFAESFMRQSSGSTSTPSPVSETDGGRETTTVSAETLPGLNSSDLSRNAHRAGRRNPYDPAQPADKDVFVGRDDLKRALAEGLQDGRSFGLAGESGMGKTSLLQAVKRELWENSALHGSLPVPVYLDFADETYHSADTVFLAILDGLIVELRERYHLECPETIVLKARDEARQGRMAEALKPILDWSFTRQQRTHLPILLLDDLHRVRRSPWLAEMASILQKSVNQHKLALVLTGKNALAEELRNDVSPLRLLFTQHFTLEALTYPETGALVQKAAEFGWEIEDRCSDLAYEMI